MMDAGHTGFRKKKKHEDVLIDFTPMVDAMFLLLMFNMIAYTITGTTDVQVPEARFAKGEDDRSAVIVTILEPKTSGGDPQIFLGDSSGKLTTPDEIRQVVEDAKIKGNNKVVIKAERRVPYKTVLEVSQAAGATEDIMILFAVQGVAGKSK